jgi:N-acetyl-alpha-D-muramate 1-phosphate uridylyltransferase
MKAMIFAAGKGERMRPLTDHTPKPLLLAAGKPIIEYTIEQLVSAGFTELLINTAHLGAQFAQTLGDGSRWGVRIQYIDEGSEALETAGGIINALPYLGDEPFLVVNGDIATQYNFASLRTRQIDWAHMVLIPNPAHHQEGDFHCLASGQLSLSGLPKFTYSGIGLYHPRAFWGRTPGVRKLRPVLEEGIAAQKITGEVYTDFWMDIGTVERLQALDTYYRDLRG